MRTVFTTSEEDEFAEARHRLLVEFDAWADMRQRAVDLPVAGSLLDFRYSHDGLLGRWNPEVLRFALLTWFPNEEPEWEPATVLATIEALLDFLADADLLDERSETPEVLRPVLKELADEFEAAMADPVEADEDVVDSAVHAAVFVLPSEEEARAEAAGTAVVARLRLFTQWVGEGRRLTPARDLQPADAVELGELLGLSDHGVAELFTLAKAVRAVRTVKGLLVRVKRAAAMLADPLLLWDAVVRQLIEVEDQFVPGGRDDGQLAYILLAGVQYADVPAPMPVLRQMLAKVAELPPDAEMVWHLVTRLAEHGLLARYPATEEYFDQIIEYTWASDIDEVVEQDRQVVELRPLGSRALYELMSEAGIRVLTVADLADETVEVLVTRLGQLSLDEFDEGAAAWLSAREPRRAIEELSAYARRTDDFEHRMLAFRMLTEHGAEGIEAIVRLRDHPTSGPSALNWLVDAGLVDASEVTGRERVYGMVDALAASFRAAREHEALAEFATQARPAQLVFVADVTVCGHPRAREVLEMMAAAHPDRTVSNAARKALDWIHDEVPDD